MFAVFSAPDAALIVALLGWAGAQFQARRTAKKAEAVAKVERTQIAAEFKNNGGKTMRDAIDRIEQTLKLDVLPRLDHGADVIASHADRLAVLEARPKPRKANP